MNLIRRFFFTILCNLCGVVAAQQVFYVSPNGNDKSNGSIKAPWRTFQHAVNSVRKYRSVNPGVPVKVLFASGTYYMDRTIKFLKEDSGTSSSPIVYKAMDNAKPVFSGSIPLRSWKKVRDKKVLSKLSEDISDNLYVCDIPESFNVKSLPAKTGIRIPLNNISERLEGFRSELVCNDKFQTLSRYPNKGFIYIDEIMSQPDKIDINKDVKFKWRNSRISKWKDETEVYLGGYWKWDWCDEYQKVSKIDDVDSCIILSKPYHSRGYKNNAPFWGVNLLCELDSISEYYIDRKQNKIYWCPENFQNIKSLKVGLTSFSEPYMVEFDDCSNIIFDGLTFRDGATIGLRINNGENIKVKSCCFICFSESAIHIFGGKDHQISGCLMKEFGERVIQIIAGNKKDLVPANHMLDNNIIQNFSIVKRTYEPAVYFSGTGLSIVNNYFSDCPSSALRIDGNEVLIEYNEFVNLVQESDDQGVIDMWKDLSNQGVRICNNYFQDIKGGTKYGSAAVRFDDMISGTVVRGNIFNRAGSRFFGAIQIHGGKENTVENNLFYNCLAAISFTQYSMDAWKLQLESSLMKDKHYKKADISSEKYRKKYPILKDLYSNLNKNHVWHNLIVNCNIPYLREGDYNNLVRNYFIDRIDKPIEYFYSEEVLKQFGLKKLEREKMGVKSNIWINDIE